LLNWLFIHSVSPRFDGGGGMKVTVGTFNLNNLFSRFNFSGAIDEIQTGGPTGEVIPSVRTFRIFWPLLFDETGTEAAWP
jgi:hypothetical protein